MSAYIEPAVNSSRLPLVSVVIAAHKADRYLELAVRDAVAQTYPALEVLVSDDAASPDTRAVIERAGGSRVRYHANPHRLGAAGNHWAAFQVIKGEWIAILNHDDRWEPTFVEKLMNTVAPYPDAVVGFCDHKVIDHNGDERIGAADRLSTIYGRDKLKSGRQPSLNVLVIKQSIPMAMGAIFRRSALDITALPPHAGPAYDLWLSYLLARSGGSAVYVNERLTSWREHPQNLTTAVGTDWLSGAADCWGAMLADPMFARHRNNVRQQASAAYLNLAICNLKNGQKSSARAAATAAIRADLLDVKAAATFLLSFFPIAFARTILKRG